MQVFTVVPLINAGIFKWGVKAPKQSYETHPPTVAKFVAKMHAERFAQQCNAGKVAA